MIPKALIFGQYPRHSVSETDKKISVSFAHDNIFDDNYCRFRMFFPIIIFLWNKVLKKYQPSRICETHPKVQWMIRYTRNVTEFSFINSRLLDLELIFLNLYVWTNFHFRNFNIFMAAKFLSYLQILTVATNVHNFVFADPQQISLV